MEEYQHPLFFEARDLTDREKEKIRRHFQRRRDSGGGDCGETEKFRENIYRVSFKDKQDQQRVFQRRIHTIPLPGGEVRLIVRQTSSPPSRDQPLVSQIQTCTKSNTKGLERIFRTNVFILYYLRDNPKAFIRLQKQLSSIGCMLELDCDEEEAVVRGDAEKGVAKAFGGVAEKWELQVERIFFSLIENYCCHHVLEPKQIKKVLQDFSFVTDDIRVYLESGDAVVVGETKAVEKIALVEKTLPTRKELQVEEKKFKLVIDEFSRVMSADSPEVKVIRGTNIIVLEGSDEKVTSGAAKLDELIKRIKEKKVRLNADLLTFMTISGIISKYQARFQQSLRSPVSIEVGSTLIVSSLNPIALYKAETAVLRDLSVASVQLQGPAAVPPDLDKVKETLLKAKNEANSGELRVDVSFVPASTGTPAVKVQLVGYTEHVNKLKELLHNYLANQILTQEVLILQLPEMVDRFDEILKMIGMTTTNVTLKAFHFPSPCVLLSGPICRVKETQQTLTSALASLTLDTLVLDGLGALCYFQGDGKVSKELVEGSCQVLIWGQVANSPTGTTKPPSISSHSLFTSSSPITRSRFNAVGNSSVSKINLEIKICSLEEEQVNVLVAPMLNKNMASTNIGKDLLQKGGNTVQTNFNSQVSSCTLLPGDVLQVDASSSLGCSKIFFIECLPWDGVTGQSMQALGNGLKRCLDLCVQHGFSSVAIPVIGPGTVLNYPLSEAVQVLIDNIHQFRLSSGSGILTTIHVVIKPGYPDSEECYHEVCKRLSFNMNQGGQALYKFLNSDLDDVEMIVGNGAKLQVVFGDITNETTDALVNTIGRSLCKDILTKAGPEVEAELKTARVNRGGILKSGPGFFSCKAILHVCGEKDVGVLEELVWSIIDCCERDGLKSVAIPAIQAGPGGLEPTVVAGAILRGIKAATSSTRLYSLNTIRLVLIKMDVFLTFKQEAIQMFSPFRQVSVPRLSEVQQRPSLKADPSILNIITASQQSTFHFLGLSRNVDNAMEKFKKLYKSQCSSQTFKKVELEGLNEKDILYLQQLIESYGLYIQNDPSGDLTVSGINDGVKKVIMLLHDSLTEKVRIKEEEDLYTCVAWCILGQNGHWERLSKTANYSLEKKDVAGGIQDAQGVLWQVDLQNMEATTQASGKRTKLKRLENLPDFTYPLYWDTMAAGEVTKVVELQPSSQEYQMVQNGFQQTVNRNVIKIERLQNIHLLRAYKAQKKHLSEKNKRWRGGGEKLLYHGTTLENSESIMKTGFNRRFAGQNATTYGEGTYFAVHANYSAKATYSKPDCRGFQRMFVAKVLTGFYTRGGAGMKVPPPVDDRRPHDRYDSLVDKMHNPNMYVVFHDAQAYPEYLITFRWKSEEK